MLVLLQVKPQILQKPLHIKSPKKFPSTKIQEPDTFDGSNSHKLQLFLVQCTLNFWDCPDAFSSNSAKCQELIWEEYSKE